MTNFSTMECNAWTSRGHHKSGLHAHRAITGDHEFWGRVSNRRLCISAEAAATARGSAHPTLKQGRTAEQNSRDPQFQADNPNRSHLSILAPRTSRVPSTSRSPVDHRASLSTAWSFVMSAVTSSRCTETTPGYDSVMRQLRIASPKSNPGGCSIGSGQDMLVDLQRKLARVMVPGSLPLASAPPRFPVGELGFSASRAEGCGFVRVDNVLGSGAATPEICRRCSVRDGLPTRR
jgi:hypothetical protein